ncbi:Tctex1 domain-containing protein 1 [Holothuria leucospilota]|uniref:Tctex1 domain-containing protein 1 n=1 Tax=Holothuria leucospilota TaxID=206669 RepID=A0A9Q1HBG9_HOLLE|nr:Tctex1 domain-containing protein 1 [Holothuria leucospilota]
MSLAARLLKASQKLEQGDTVGGEATPSETSESTSLVAKNPLQRKASVWSNVAKRFNTPSKSSEKRSFTPKIRYENNYKLQPDEDIEFDEYKVRRFVEEILNMRLKNEQYDKEKSSALCTSLADVIKGRVKKMGFKRHKIVVHVVMGSKEDQSLNISSRCVWDTKTDNCATINYENQSMFVTATVFALYFE